MGERLAKLFHRIGNLIPKSELTLIEDQQRPTQVKRAPLEDIGGEEIDEVLTRLLLHWKEVRVKPAAATASLEEIAAWESQFSVQLPDDLRAYVLRVNGNCGGEQLDFDNNLNSLLPLQAMKPESDWANQHSSIHFVFADHCLSCFWWTVELTSVPRPQTAVYIGGTVDGTHKLIANTLCGFLELYMKDDRKLYEGTSV